MKELQEKVKAILSEIENNFKDEKDIEFAKTKVLELYEVFADELEELEAVCSDKIDIISAKYSVLEEKMNEVQERIDRIQKDFYVEDVSEAFADTGVYGSIPYRLFFMEKDRVI